MLARNGCASTHCSRTNSQRALPSARSSRPSTHRVKQVAAAAATQRLYEWSRQLDAALVESLPELQLQPSPGESVQALVTKLAAAADGGAATAPSSSTTPTSNSHTLSASSVDAILQQLPASTLSTQLTAPQAATLLASLARLRAQVPASWLEAVLAGPLAGEAAVQACSTRQIAEATWAVSELCEASGPGSAVMAWATSLLAAVVPHLADFYAPDLAALVGSCGALHREMLTQPSTDGAAGAAMPSSSSSASDATPAWLQAVADEACYQLAEFMADFKAMDVAQLASGLADLKVPLDSKLKNALMKAVYSKTNTIEEKAAVDFALAKLEAGARTMVFDPRWTHEELRWLPRSERDKRRIIKEGWVRTKWGGWTPGRS